MKLLRRGHTTPARVAEPATWSERLGGFLLWYVLPTLAIGIVLAYVVLAVVLHSNPPVVPVTGRSMQPTLHAGDLVFVEGVEARRLKAGDIIAFRTTKEMQQKYDVPPEYVHRIVHVGKTPTGYEFKTKGDNVAGPDPFVTYERDVVGKYAGKLTGAGFPLLFLRSRQGMIFGAAVLVVLLLYFVFGFWERRQEALETNAVTMEQIVAEARALRDSMLAGAGAPRAPPEVEEERAHVADTAAAPAAEGARMLAVDGVPPEGAVLCSRGCHVLLPGARFDPHTGEPVEVPVPEPETPRDRSSQDPAEPGYVPVWERAQAPHLAEYELAPAYREEQAPEPARTVDAYLAGEIDFERLEREIHEAVRSSADVKETMRELVGAIGEYGEHLQSHTAVMRGLAAATGDLQATTVEMREFLASLTGLLRSLVEQRGEQA